METVERVVKMLGTEEGHKAINRILVRRDKLRHEVGKIARALETNGKWANLRVWGMFFRWREGRLQSRFAQARICLRDVEEQVDILENAITLLWEKERRR